MQKKFEHSLKHFDILQNAKSDLLNRWISAEDVRKTLNKHHIASSFFAQYFGSRVLDYAAGVIQGKNLLGHCPMISVMLAFFEKKDIPLGDVFLICVNLKNTLIDYFLEKGLLSHDILNEVCTIIDHNFLGVIEEYLEMHYSPASANDTCPLENKSNEPNVTFCTMAALLTNAQKTSALQYTQDVEIDSDILDELAELEGETLSSLGLTESISQALQAEMTDLFTNYAKMIDRLMEFQEISYALWILIDLLQKIDLADMEEESTYIVIYTKAIITDLSIWRKSVFIDKNAEDIHYLDKTLLSSITQLQIMLSSDDNADITDIEFFD